MARAKANAGEMTVFCQIAGKDISPESCRSTQGQEGCFGCASPTRRCEKCQMNLVTVAATGTCSTCTAAEIEAEKEVEFPKSAARVDCQQMKRPVSVSMCQTMQDPKACRNCAAPSRICETCQTRPVRFPQYGLCFTCTVSEMGEGWTAEEVTEDADSPETQLLQVLGGMMLGKTHASLSLDDIKHHFSERFGKGYTREITAKWVGDVLRHGLGLTLEESHGRYQLFISDTRDIELMQKQRERSPASGDITEMNGGEASEPNGTDSDHGDGEAAVAPTPSSATAAPEAGVAPPTTAAEKKEHDYQRVRAVIIQTQSASATTIRENVQIGQEDLHAILRRLEEEKVVGARGSGPRGSRRVLIPQSECEVVPLSRPHSSSATGPRRSTQASRFGDQQKIVKLEQLRETIGEGSEYGRMLLEVIDDLRYLEKVRKAVEILKE